MFRRSIMLKSLLFLVVCFHLPAVLTAQSNTVQLTYRFNEGENVQYKTERLDSMSFEFGGQSMSRKITSWSLQNISVVDKPSTAVTHIKIQTDSTWNDQESNDNSGRRTSSASGGSQRGGGRRMVMRSGPGSGEDGEYRINQWGLSTTEEPGITPLLIPLPEKPFSINDSWDFNLPSEIKGHQKGNITVTGQCLLYELSGSENSTAVIIVNYESKRDAEFRFQSPQGSISGSSASVSQGTQLVYFDISKGRIVETIREETTESSNETSMGSSNSSSSSKSTIKLINS
ncbi:hypothetical protein BVY01_00030 [bacterium I07]|nr:hypothetical protein BVY01_00030 [bacterium I07]